MLHTLTHPYPPPTHTYTHAHKHVHTYAHTHTHKPNKSYPAIHIETYIECVPCTDQYIRTYCTVLPFSLKQYTPTNSDNLLPEHIFSFKIEDNRSHTDFSDMGRIMYATLDDVCWYLTYDLATSRDGIVSVMATTCKAEAKRFYFVEPPFS